MKKIDLGQTVAIVANIGVLGGLLLLAYELQQNNELLEAQARYNHKETRANQLGELSSNPGLAAIIVKTTRGDDLTPLEQVQLNSFIDKLFVSWEWEFYEATEGRLNLPIAAYRNDMLKPGTRERWEETKFQYSEPFVVFMDQNVTRPQP